jgi:hypothetical protein
MARLADVIGVDLVHVGLDKVTDSDQRYPVDRAGGIRRQGALRSLVHVIAVR